jgi:hypothetical protein
MASLSSGNWRKNTGKGLSGGGRRKKNPEVWSHEPGKNLTNIVVFPQNVLTLKQNIKKTTSYERTTL